MITPPCNTTFHLCASLFRQAQSALYIIEYFSPRNILEIPRDGYYHSILQLGKGMWLKLSSVQAPSLPMVSILKLLQETSSHLKIKLSPWRLSRLKQYINSHLLQTLQ